MIALVTWPSYPRDFHAPGEYSYTLPYWSGHTSMPITWSSSSVIPRGGYYCHPGSLPSIDRTHRREFSQGVCGILFPRDCGYTQFTCCRAYVVKLVLDVTALASKFGGPDEIIDPFAIRVEGWPLLHCSQFLQELASHAGSFCLLAVRCLGYPR